jgi:uncharacterized protein
VTTHLLTWSGLDDTTRVDHASVELHRTSMRAVGGSVARTFSSSWELDVDCGWVTRGLRLTTRGFGWGRSLELTRSTAGEWVAEVSARGDAHLPDLGLADAGSLAGAVDCDLGLCPVTNTMPWVDVPSLRVIRSDQVYGSGPASDPARVHFRSLKGGFAAQLTVDDDGFVIDYPTLAHRSDGSRTSSR